MVRRVNRKIASQVKNVQSTGLGYEQYVQIEASSEKLQAKFAFAQSMFGHDRKWRMSTLSGRVVGNPKVMRPAKLEASSQLATKYHSLTWLEAISNRRL